MSLELPWWASLKHGGLFLSAPRLAELFSAPAPALPLYIVARLRGDLQRLAESPEDAAAQKALLDTVLHDLAGLRDSDTTNWQRGNDVEPRFARRAASGEMVRPRRVYTGPNGALLPVFVDEEPRLGLGRGRRSVSRVVEWCRGTGHALALLTNARQFRLLHVAAEHDAFCEWDSAQWFEAGQLSPQVEAWQHLLAPALHTPPQPGALSPLLDAIRRSRQGQSQLTSLLGERVRQAVEVLIHAHTPYLNRQPELDRAEVYRAANLVVMRLVVGLFAEARDLFPRSNRIYETSYGLQGLWEKLARASGGQPARLRTRFGAWPQVLALFRLIHDGSPHGELSVRAYGGELFRPGTADAPEGVRRAMHLFETACYAGDPSVMSDAEVHTLLDLLTRCAMPVRQGRSVTTVTVPVDFADLSTEYIGILYEGLLDYELHQVPVAADDPVLFINLGDQPALPLSRLEALTGPALKTFFKEFTKSGGSAAASSGEEDAAEDDAAETAEADPLSADDSEPLTAADTAPADAEAEPADTVVSARQRALAWARRAVVEAQLLDAKVIKAATGQDPGRRAEAEEKITRAANQLVARTILPGDFFLVRWGGTRKGQGSFYTRPGLVAPTVQRTLAPLCYDLPAEPTFEQLRDPATPRSPAVILDLKVCDPATGSASFPVSALRYLAEALWRSLLHHGWLVVDDGDRGTGGGERGTNLSGRIYEYNQLSGSGGLADRDGSCGALPSVDAELPAGGIVRAYQSDTTGGRVGAGEHRGGAGTQLDQGVSPLPEHSAGLSARGGNTPAVISTSGDSLAAGLGTAPRAQPAHQPDASSPPPSPGTPPLTDGARELANGTRRTGNVARENTAQDSVPPPPVPRPPNPAHAAFFRPGPGLPAGNPTWFRECVRDLPGDLSAAEGTIRARLKRLIVERCLYGVDLDPLAIELARLSLWIETMDRDLPFGFLDHKFKCGNGLVGCWFDRFQDYPALALHRPTDDAGDKTHTTGVHLEKGRLSDALKTFRDDTLKPALVRWIEAQDPGVFAFLQAGQSAADLQLAAIRRMEELHALPVHETEQRAAFYRDQVEPALVPLRAAFDLWCALWFWPVDELAHLPLPGNFTAPSAEALTVVARLRAQLRFFHWELEFPDVFTGPDAGFHAILGNPPWEVQKPSSKEWFSNHDPLYRTYGKQEALRRQKELFALDAVIERDWVSYCGRFKALSNWCANAAFPWADPADEAAGGNKWSLASRATAAALHRTWRDRRATRRSFSDRAHAFRHQGSADLNTYKLFLEQMHALLRPGGRLGVIVPSNVYTDKGSTTLRRLFLDRCRWEWLFGFENRDKIFDIHRSFKFCPIIVQKGGETVAIRTAFMRRSLQDWAEAERFALPYARDQVTRFSPKSLAILELRSVRDAEILDKMYRHGVLLGDDSPQGWGLKYATEFHMTNDSKLFPPRPVWEEQGYQPDEYGHWLKGNWQPTPTTDESWLREPWRRARSILNRPEGLILSRDGRSCIQVQEIEDVALPLYEGRMIDHFDFSSKGWVSGKGRSAVWRDIPWENKVIEPQYLMGRSAASHTLGLKISFLDIGSATNARSMVASAILGAPCGNVAPILTRSGSLDTTLGLAAALNCFAYDFAVRLRLGGLHLNYFVIEETPLARVFDSPALVSATARWSLALNFPAPFGASLWAETETYVRDASWTATWALTDAERARGTAIIEALMAHSLGLDAVDYAELLRDCDHPSATVRTDDFARTLDPKGFWRVDKEKDPELRHTVLAQVAFQDLQRVGLDAFLAQNQGEGWQLPETLRLSDYGLGHDARARDPQPVASRLGPRFHAWQLEGTLEESWEECRRHASLIQSIRSPGAAIPPPPPQATTTTATEPAPATDLLGTPIETDLFGNEVVKRSNR